MMGLLVFKERLKNIYGKYDIYINPVLKFILAYVSLTILNQNIGFMTSLKMPVVPLVIGIICSFLPYGAITLIVGIVMVAHIFSVSFEISLIVGILFIVVILMYYGFQPGDSYLLLLTPILFFWKIPYVIPLLVGLSGSIVSIIPVSCGICIYYIIMYVKQNAGVLTNDASVDITQKYVQIIKSIMSNKNMLIMIAAFAICIMIVYLIHNLSVDYSWVIAIVVGTISLLVMIFMGTFIYNITVNPIQFIIGVVFSALIAGLYDFFVFAVDYSRTEHVQFEDDDYYYYVKAVPKIVVTTPDVKVQKINARQHVKKPAK